MKVVRVTRLYPKELNRTRYIVDPKEASIGLAIYEIVGAAGEWRVRHDGQAKNEESTFEADVAAASLALRQGHEVRIAPASATTTGAADPSAR